MDTDLDYTSLNALLNLWGDDGELQLDADLEARDAYLKTEVAPKEKQFDTLADKINWLFTEGYYDRSQFHGLPDDQILDLFTYGYSLHHEFRSMIGAVKFYVGYAMRTNDQTQFLESFTDRAVVCAIVLSGGDLERTRGLIEDIITGRTQPATPTFLSTGKVHGGAMVSCFLIQGGDSMEAIDYVDAASRQLSKRGGGVGICLTNLRETGAPIQDQADRASGLVPVMKILEDDFSYANQLGQRQGAGAVYVNLCHPDIHRVLDTKRENADEKVRIKTLSLGVVIPDIAFDMARANEDLALFSPYGVEKVMGAPMTEFSVTEHYDEWVADDRITKYWTSARGLFQTIAELQFESGYPYLMFEDTANEWNYINGRISHSNLCSEVCQISTPSEFGTEEYGDIQKMGRDISCNLASMNVAAAMHGDDLAGAVSRAVRALTEVSDRTSLGIVPTVREGNRKSHSIGLGQMNLHGFLGSEKIMYGSDEALDFVNTYFAAIRFHSLWESSRIAEERGETFFEFEKSGYHSADGEASEALWHYTEGIWLTTPQTERIQEMFEQYGHHAPTVEDWKILDKQIQTHGLYNAYLSAVAPTGSISYINHATSSIHPIVSKIEIRKEGKIGRVYTAAPGMDSDNMDYFTDAYELGYKPLIDTYAVAQKHIDQSQSLTLFFKDKTTTRDLNKAYIYAWSRGRAKNEFGEIAVEDPRTAWKSGFIKTLYYTRIRQAAMEGTEAFGCVSCAI